MAPAEQSPQQPHHRQLPLLGGWGSTRIAKEAQGYGPSWGWAEGDTEKSCLRGHLTTSRFSELCSAPGQAGGGLSQVRAGKGCSTLPMSDLTANCH
jgi:hypothetical protein